MWKRQSRVMGRILSPQNMSGHEILKLRSGRNPASLFCLLGTDLYEPLANELDSDIDVYGIYVEEVGQHEIHTKAADCGIDYVSRLSEYVDSYFRLIKEVLPQGPCYICGFSFGGYVAIELAKKLQQKGIQVPVVSMFDTFYIRNEKPLSVTEKLFAHYEMGKQHGFMKMLIAKLAEKNIYRFNKKNEKNSDPDALLRKAKMNARMHMAMNYQPDVYSGFVQLFTAEYVNPYTKRAYDECLGWKSVLSDINVYKIEAEHHNLLKHPSVKAIAKIISDSIQL